jgi:hypothetical protein
LSQAQQKIFDEENPELDGSQSWLTKSTSVMTSASELSSSESSPMSTSASEGDVPTKQKRAENDTKSNAAARWRDAGDTVRKENKKLQAETKKAKATADNLKKKMKQDKQALQIYITQVRNANGEIDKLKQEMKQTKAIQDKNKAQADEIHALKAEVMVLKRNPQRQLEPEHEPAPEPAPEPETEDPSPEPEARP